ncbi:protein OSCP1-like [Poecilia latipinna]|uniref:protein OSCP1-like n=1 Tax=Poecilia formosa TaxID=48698 RepID=UPI0004438EAA|nr:PREDICTED: protein OSCP1-like [Poecilia formosa]XP_014871440.1 PREDICTED: protein OSCP1-like [Poecilia latipinna]
MSVRTLPLVFINLGGEMLYILDQRLRALNTSEDQSETGVWSERDRKRVLNDVVGTMFSKSFMDELLKPQQLYSHRTMKTVLTRLAHSSIMRLNPASMDRLYELMIMAFKYQVLLSPRPRDLLLISYNHLDAARAFVRDTPAVLNQVDETHRKIIEVYSRLSDGEFQLLRQTLLTFLQDVHTRVSVFLKNQIQNPSGRFVLMTSGPVPAGVDVPGLIRTFDPRGREVGRSEFPPGGTYSGSVGEGSFELSGDRVLRLGQNLYQAERPEETQTSSTPGTQLDRTNPLAKEELNLLARLMGCMKAGSVPAAAPRFRISLFPSDPEEEEEGGAPAEQAAIFQVINIQAVQDEEAASALARIAGQFTDEEAELENPSGSKGDDLLAMMDDL